MLPVHRIKQENLIYRSETSHKKGMSMPRYTKVAAPLPQQRRPAFIISSLGSHCRAISTLTVNQGRLAWPDLAWAV